MRRSPGTSVDEPIDLEIVRMRRRHLRGVMAIERQVYPRPWSPNLFLSEMNELRHRAYLVARVARDVVGYGGALHNPPLQGPRTHTPLRSPHQPPKTGNRLLL